MKRAIFHALQAVRDEHRVEACFHVAYYSAAVLDFGHLHHFAEIGIIVMTIMALMRHE